MATEPTRCAWLTLKDALHAFVANIAIHQSSGHIKPLHWYVGCRLVLEGGFLPDEVTPRPPFVAHKTSRGWNLAYDAGVGGVGERDVLGGLKTKQVDVTVCKPDIGPVIAVSMKGTLNAFRNLTNRMEEAVGDCTNLHLAYPALVYGFLHVMRANRAGTTTSPNDVAICADGSVSDSIVRYHDVLVRLCGRDDMRAETTRYESVGLALVQSRAPTSGTLFDGFPSHDSPLHLSRFFARLYEQYDRRFVFSAPALEPNTRRREWTLDRSVSGDARCADITARVLE